jgi:hypothetical protein
MAGLAIVGLSTPAWAIQGGSNAEPGEFPWSVSIETWDRSAQTWDHICTGAYLGQRAVLTAAHCVGRLPATGLRVMGGTISRSDLTHAQISGVVSYKVNENYGVGTGDYPNDIAIVYLDDDLTYCGSVPLPRYHWPETPPDPCTPDPTAGETCSVVGWGLTSTSNVPPDILQVATMTAISTKTANNLLAPVLNLEPEPSPWVVNDQLALYDSRHQVTMERGDGLAFCTSGGRTYLAGIQSWGVMSSGMDLASYPTVTTPVSAYLD